MYETHHDIGSATQLEAGAAFRPDKGIGFVFDYGEDRYGLAFSNEEMDSLLKNGIEKMLGGRAIGGFDFAMDLDDGEWPLFIGPRSIEVPPNPNGYHDAIMETNIVTAAISHHLEQRGVLLARRHSWNGSWEFARYDVQPPLKEWPAAIIA